jgi:hypothetical protein
MLLSNWSINPVFHNVCSHHPAVLHPAACRSAALALTLGRPPNMPGVLAAIWLPKPANGFCCCCCACPSLDLLRLRGTGTAAAPAAATSLLLQPAALL